MQEETEKDFEHQLKASPQSTDRKKIEILLQVEIRAFYLIVSKISDHHIKDEFSFSSEFSFLIFLLETLNWNYDCF